MSNMTPLTGMPLEQPDPPPLRVFAVWEGNKPCTDHQVAYSGSVPCTGMLTCSLCGTQCDPGTGKLAAYDVEAGLARLRKWMEQEVDGT